MTKINLLPWREQLRDEQQKQFYYLLGLCVVISLVLMLLIHLTMNYRLSSQKDRNKRLMHETNLLNGKIYAIRSLRDKKDRLITRINIIKALQTNRPQAVYLFDEMNRIVPNGIILTEIERKRKNLTFTGVADSHTHISLMMKRVDESQWISKPVLDEIKEIHVDNRSMQYFKLRVMMKSLTAQSK